MCASHRAGRSGARSWTASSPSPLPVLRRDRRAVSNPARRRGEGDRRIHRNGRPIVQRGAGRPHAARDREVRPRSRSLLAAEGTRVAHPDAGGLVHRAGAAVGAPARAGAIGSHGGATVSHGRGDGLSSANHGLLADRPSSRWGSSSLETRNDEPPGSASGVDQLLGGTARPRTKVGKVTFDVLGRIPTSSAASATDPPAATNASSTSIWRRVACERPVAPEAPTTHARRRTGQRTSSRQVGRAWNTGNGSTSSSTRARWVGRRSRTCRRARRWSVASSAGGCSLPTSRQSRRAARIGRR